MAAPGYDQQLAFQREGFTPEQITAWREQRAQELLNEGFTAPQIAAYFGEGPIQAPRLRDDVSSAFVQTDPEGEDDSAEVAKGFLKAAAAGWQGSVTGLAERGDLPEIVLSEDANFFEVAGSALGQFAGDLPVSLPAFFAGVPLGAGVGAAAGGAATRNPIATGAGTVVGGAIAGEATSGFITEATRQSLINFYEDNANRGKPVDAREFAGRYVSAVLQKSTFIAGGKGAAVGAAAGATGGVGRVALPAVVKSPVARQAVLSTSEAAAAVAATAAIEQEMPNASAFGAAAAIALGLDASFAIGSRVPGKLKDATKRLQDHYIATGERPEAVAERMATDVNLRQAIATGENKTAAPDTIETSITFEGDTERLIMPRSPEVDAADTAHSKIVAAARPSAMAAPTSAPTTPGDAVANIRAKIKAPDAAKKSLQSHIDDIRYKYVNDLQYVVSEANSAYRDATDTRLSVESNPGELMRLAYGAHARAEQEIWSGVYDKSGTKVLYSFSDVLDSLGQDRYDDFMAYAVARRVLEKSKQGMDTGFDVLDADLVVKANAKNDKFKNAFANLQSWQNSQLARAKEAGLLDKDSLQKIVAQNRDYVPFSRVLQEGKGAPEGVTRRGLPVRKVTKKFKGGEQDIIDPFEVAIKNRYAIEQVISNNIARQRLVDFNNNLPEASQFLKKQDRALSVVEIAKNDKELAKFLEDNGLDIEDATGLHLYRSMAKRLDSGEFLVFVDGKPEVYKADNPDLVKSLSKLDDSSRDIVLNIFQKMALAQRAGVTIAPEFVVKASLRDQLQGFLQNPFTVVPFVDAFSGALSLYKKDNVVNRWINSGGANSAMLAIDARLTQKKLRDKIYKNPTPEDLLTAKFWWNVGLTPVRFMQNVSMFAENAMRVGRFKRAEKEGLSQEVAALQSRDVSLDFARMGANVRAYNMITSWVGASINGIDRFHTAFSRDPVGTTLKTLATITVPTLVLHALNRDEEWYQRLPEWERMTFWHFNTGRKDESGNPIIVKFPMPFQFGAIFGYLPVRMMEEMEAAEPEVGDGIWQTLKSAYSVPALPTFATPILELAANYSFFRDGQIVSDAQMRQLPEYRYTPYTTQLTREISKTLSTVGFLPDRYTSPIALEHMVRGYGGILGDQMLRKLDEELRAKGVIKNVPPPAQTLADDPVTGQFFVRNSSAGRALDEFYENAESMDQIKASMKQEAERGGADEVDRILRVRGAPGVDPQAARDAIGKLRKMSYAIHFNPDMDPREKRQLIDEIAKNQFYIAKAYNEAYDSFKRAEKERKKQ